MERPSLSYLIDDSYAVLSFNQPAAEAFPGLKVGGKCYECLYGFDSPCPPCPVANQLPGPHHFYDTVRKMGETVDDVEMALPDGTNAHMLVIAVDDDDRVSDGELDQLTGFLNRSGLQRFCDSYTPSAPDAIFEGLALEVVSIDEIAYSHGHEVARDVVRDTARHLKGPGCTLAYSGAGLFLGIAERSSEDELPDIEAIIEDIEASFSIPGVHIKAGLYLGSFSDDSLAAALGYAETALNSIRTDDNCVIKKVDRTSYEAMMSERAAIDDVLNGLENGEFDIYLQPKCQIATGALVGSEALARWIKPDGTVVPPGAFVPLLEKAGLISRLDYVVWEKIFSYVGAWVAQGHEPLPVSVNVSRADAERLDVAEVFSKLRKRYKVPDGIVEAEITESAYAEDEGVIVSTERNLQEAGFRVLVDDFGSGYSSLAMLKDVNADILKLDMGFLDFDEDDKSRAIEIVHSVLEMAHQLDMYVVAEGVETEEQATLLNDLGCQFAQGYYFYKPLPRAEFEKLLQGTTSYMIPTWDRSHRKSSVQRLAEYFWRLAEVNVDTGAYRFIRNVSEPSHVAFPRPATIAEHGERYIENGFIHPDDVERYRHAMDVSALRHDLEAGAHRERLPFRFLENGCWKWYILEQVLPEDYSADEPWVLFTWKDAADDTARREDIEALTLFMFSRMYRINLSTEEFERIWEGENEDPSAYPEESLPELALRLVAAGVVHPEDAASLLSVVNIGNMRRHFLEQSSPVDLIFRKKRDGGWVPRIIEVKRSVEFSQERPIVVATLRDAKMWATAAQARLSIENAAMRTLFDETREAALYEFVFNASTGTMVYMTDPSGFFEDSGIDAVGLPITSITSKLAEKTMTHAHAARYIEAVDPARLVKLFESGTHYDSLDFQRQVNGELRWLRIVVHLYSPAESTDIWGNAVVCDITQEVSE